MKRVLFIDVRNTARGPMAEAWFNHLSLGLARAASCGTMPASRFDMSAVQVMAEIRVPIRPHLPKPLSQQALSRADAIVIMGKDVPADAFPNVIVWDLRDPTGESLEVYRALREQIRVQVEGLLHTRCGLPSIPPEQVLAAIQLH